MSDKQHPCEYSSGVISNNFPEEEIIMKNYYIATAAASKITGVPVEEIRTNFRKGAKPTGKMLNAVIVAKQIYNGTFVFRDTAPVAAEQQ